MWLKGLSAHSDLPVLYSSVGFSALRMLLTEKKIMCMMLGISMLILKGLESTLVNHF